MLPSSWVNIRFDNASYYAPILGDDPKARALNLVRQTIRTAGQLSLRDSQASGPR